MTLYSILEVLSGISPLTILAVIVLIFIGIPTAYEGYGKWKKMFGKSNREIKDEDFEERLDNLEKKITDEVEKLNVRIDGMYQKQDQYHDESISIRGNLANKQEDLLKAIGDVTELLSEMKQEQRDEKIQRMRWQILEVANHIKNKEDVNMEQLNNTLDTYDDYEKVLEKNGLQNGQVDISIQLVREKMMEIIHGEKYGTR